MSSSCEFLLEAASAKCHLIKKSMGRALVYAVLAGIYVGLAIILIATIGGYLNPVAPHLVKLVMGLCFGIALSLVMVCGADLFTGNNMLMSVSMMAGKHSWKDTLKLWFTSYFGNFTGAILLALVFTAAGLNHGKTGAFFVKLAEMKAAGSFGELFWRGVLCNILVCLAVYSALKMKSESGRLIMIFWCLFAFITSGYEHSVANMTVYSVALLSDYAHETLSLSTMAHNLIPVTLGNIVGGCLLGWAYAYVYGVRPLKH